MPAWQRGGSCSATEGVCRGCHKSSRDVLLQSRNQRPSAAGVIFAATTTRQHAQSSTLPATAGSSLQGSGARGPFPAEPYLVPSSSCPLDTQALGPEQQPAIPINYHLVLSLSDPAFYQPGDPTGRVAAGFTGSVNITLHVQQVSWTPVVAGSVWAGGHCPRLPSCGSNASGRTTQLAPAQSSLTKLANDCHGSTLHCGLLVPLAFS